MDEQTFWSVVDDINWPKLVAERPLEGCVDVGRAKVAVMRKYSVEVMEAFREVLRKKTCHLYKVIRAHNEAFDTEIPAGGDSGDDLIHHVVGLGKQFFDSAIFDPNVLLKLPYEESFAYCIPFKTDYDRLKPGYFRDGSCKRFREEAIVFVNGASIASIYAEEVAYLTAVVEKLEADDFATLPEPETVRGVWNAIRAKVGRATGTLAELKGLDEYLQQSAWFLSNIVGDAKELV